MFALSALLTLALFSGSVQSDTGTRKIILYAPDSTDSRLLLQQKMLKADVAGLKERQIAVTLSTGSSGSAAYRSAVPGGKGFQFVLYGKDGGKKFTSDKPVTLHQLYGIIDSMPMRAEEMKKTRQP